MEASATGLIERARQRGWYHTLELRPGEWTDGWFDLRPAIKHYGLPEDMTGMRALDVGTFDGFWAFEMERRGADVVAIDVESLEAAEWPPIHRARLECEARDFEHLRRVARGHRRARGLRVQRGHTAAPPRPDPRPREDSRHPRAGRRAHHVRAVLDEGDTSRAP